MGQPEHLPPPYAAGEQHVPMQQMPMQHVPMQHVQQPAPPAPQPEPQHHTTDRGAPGGQQKKSQSKFGRQAKNLGSKMMDSMVRGFGWGIGTAMARSLMNAICGNK